MHTKHVGRSVRPGLGRRLLPAVLLLTLSCSLIEGGAATMANRSGVDGLSPTETTRPTSTPLVPADIPVECQGLPLATVGPTQAGAATPTPEANPPLTGDEQQAVAEELIRTVEDVYVAPESLGTQWRAAGASLRQHIAVGLDTEVFYSELQHLIDGLGDEHSDFQSPSDVVAADASLAGVANQVGIGVQAEFIPEAGVITLLRVFEESPAAKAGLHPHDNLLTVDGAPLIQAGVPEYWRLRGPECTMLVVSVASPGEPARQVAVVRHRYSVEQAIDTHLLPTAGGERIGYIYLPSFYDQRIPLEIEAALQVFGPLEGLIIDNRMNSGGSSTVVEPTLGLFTSGTLGQFVSREGERPLRIEPHEVHNSQSVPLVVLIGPDTVSFGEIFSGILQDTGRATLVGETTAGNVETLHGYTFEDGSRLWIAQERFLPSGSGMNWEGVGVQPDVEVVAAWHTFTAENDPVIAAAVQLLTGE